VDAEGNPLYYPSIDASFRLDRGGQYFVALDGYAPDPYTFTLTEVEPPQINTGSIEPGQMVEATLAPSAIDEWTLVAEAGQTFTIALYAQSGSFDTTLRILDENGAELVYDDDGGPGLNSQVRGWEAPVDGAYTIRVGSFSSYGEGPYMLMVEPGSVFLWPEGWSRALVFNEPYGN
jgi:hypothetical protein